VKLQLLRASNILIKVSICIASGCNAKVKSAKTGLKKVRIYGYQNSAWACGCNPKMCPFLGLKWQKGGDLVEWESSYNIVLAVILSGHSAKS
jgi:hypothetical protein